MTSRLASHSPAFALRGIGKVFGGVHACRGIDLAVQAGEVIAIAGENGAGKSTTVKCFYGLYAPDEGTVEVAGAPVRLNSPRDGEALGIAMIPQELDLFPELSIVENLFIGRARPRTAWGGFDWKAMRRKAREILAGLGVAFDVGLPVKALSAANAKLVEIARALNRDARLIIMDEPTAALTEREASRLFKVIRGLTAQGVSIIYITHRLDEIFEISGRVAVLRDGRLIACAETSSFTIASLVQAMVGRPLEQFYVRHQHSPGPEILAIEGLSLAGRFQDVSFNLRAGEVLGLSGLIGAGRSELACAIYGMEPADSGRILIDGQPVQIRSVRDAIRCGIAYLPEERRSQGLVLPASITENISFCVLPRFSWFGLIARKHERDFARKSAKRFTVAGAPLDAPVEVLSGGNQQKVLVAKTLASGPRIIILDEPTRGVDVGAKAEIYAIIDALAAVGKAIILISSEMNEVLSLSDRILVMHEGRMTGEFSRDRFSAEAIGAAAAGQRDRHAA
jgi:ABC-type sugar transport system ATPase subunit